MERTATNEELEERVKQLEGPSKLDAWLLKLEGQVHELERRCEQNSEALSLAVQAFENVQQLIGQPVEGTLLEAKESPTLERIADALETLAGEGDSSLSGAVRDVSQMLYVAMESCIESRS